MQPLIDTSYKYGFSKKEKSIYKTKKGISEKVIKDISNYKNEPFWMKKIRLNAFVIFKRKPMPTWGADLSDINFNEIYYYLKSTKDEKTSWDELPKEIKSTYEALGIPKLEQKYLSGVKAQYDSEVVYGSLIKNLKEKGVIFLSMDEGLRKYPDLVKEYFGKLILPSDNKFAALNTSFWSGGSFIYIPKGIKVEMPLQAYFRINAKRMGQFERTLIIADEKSFVHYIEGCTSPIYQKESLHAGVVEIYVKKNARVRYTTIQNWSNNVYNLVTKRAKVESGGIMEWIDFNRGSRVTMKYPSIILAGKKAHGEILSLAVASKNKNLDTGGKIIHAADKTTSRIISKSVSLKGGLSSYRGLVEILKGSKDSRAKVTCNALILDKLSSTHTFPAMQINEKEVIAEHEATVSKINEEELFYLRSRGINRLDAETLIVNGFIEPIAKELPFEYAVELNILIRDEMKKKVG